jgi:hypothetical protein
MYAMVQLAQMRLLFLLQLFSEMIVSHGAVAAFLTV